MRCGCASNRGLVVGKVLKRGMGQRVSPQRIVRLSTHNKQQLLSVLFGNVSKASAYVPDFQTPRDLRLVQTPHHLCEELCKLTKK